MTSKFEDIPNPTSLDKSKKNLIVFEDCKSLRDMWPVIRTYMTIGRHASCNLIMLSQGFTSIKASDDIRENTNFLIFMNQSRKQLSTIYDILGANSMSKQQFILFSLNAFKKYKRHGHIAFNLTNGKLLDDIFEEQKDSDDSEDDSEESD
jgi:hypothetical protein